MAVAKPLTAPASLHTGPRVNNLKLRISILRLLPTTSLVVEVAHDPLQLRQGFSEPPLLLGLQGERTKRPKVPGPRPERRKPEAATVGLRKRLPHAALPLIDLPLGRAMAVQGADRRKRIGCFQHPMTLGVELVERRLRAGRSRFLWRPCWDVVARAVRRLLRRRRRPFPTHRRGRCPRGGTPPLWRGAECKRETGPPG